MTLSEASLLAFTVFSGLRLISYLPQICKVARDPNGASAISYATWALWTGNNIATGIYAAINLSDPLLAGASGLYALSCLTVIAITAGKRHHLRLRNASTKDVSGDRQVSGRRMTFCKAALDDHRSPEWVTQIER